VYYPFRNSIENNGRIVADNPLIKGDSTYEMNFSELEEIASQKDVKLMLLCSPHNPVGRVWTKDELRHVGEICLKNNVVLLSDEIHFDILREGIEHTVINNVDSAFAENTVICTAVSKSFNLAGLGTSNIIIANKVLREKFQKQLAADGYSCINCVSRPATITAYTECDYWLDSMNKQVDKNIAIVRAYVDQIPQIKMYDCQGTYLVWLDMTSLNMSDGELDLFLRNECGIIQDPGFWFGESGKGFTRLNVACPTAVLEECMSKMCHAVSKL
jgi:bifunctional pyridoxal-dependent enzyme with beta-cystathionase and maltose regulon repressor activities